MAANKGVSTLRYAQIIAKSEINGSAPRAVFKTTSNLHSSWRGEDDIFAQKEIAHKAYES